MRRTSRNSSFCRSSESLTSEYGSNSREYFPAKGTAPPRFARKGVSASFSWAQGRKGTASPCSPCFGTPGPLLYISSFYYSLFPQGKFSIIRKPGAPVSCEAGQPSWDEQSSWVGWLGVSGDCERWIRFWERLPSLVPPLFFTQWGSVSSIHESLKAKPFYLRWFQCWDLWEWDILQCGQPILLEIGSPVRRTDSFILDDPSNHQKHQEKIYYSVLFVRFPSLYYKSTSPQH